MEQRASFCADGGESLSPIEGVDRKALAAATIISGGDVSGAVILLSDDGKAKATEADIKLIAAAAAFLGKQMEE